jgi:hypothetical protein
MDIFGRGSGPPRPVMPQEEEEEEEDDYIQIFK